MSGSSRGSSSRSSVADIHAQPDLNVGGYIHGLRHSEDGASTQGCQAAELRTTGFSGSSAVPQVLKIEALPELCLSEISANRPALAPFPAACMLQAYTIPGNQA